MTGFEDRWDLRCLRDSLSLSLSLSLELLVLLVVDRVSFGISSMSTRPASRSLEGMVSVLWSHLAQSKGLIRSRRTRKRGFQCQSAWYDEQTSAETQKSWGNSQICKGGSDRRRAEAL